MRCFFVLALCCILTASVSAAPRALATQSKQAENPPWLGSAIVYCVYPEIFSRLGFQGITDQLGRLKQLGVTVIWLMPITPVGRPFHGHPAFDSPYAVRDYYAVNPEYGSTAELKNLIDAAHRLGMKVILDEVLNHTSWDNPLTVQHPEYYRHLDANPGNPASEVQAFNFADVAQLDYSNRSSGLWAYMDKMLRYWITVYHVDGFRFDTADDPRGPGREIPKAFWSHLRTFLAEADPGTLMLGEEEDRALAKAPFQMDYGWDLQKALKEAAVSGTSADGIEHTWKAQTEGWPAGMLHMSLLQDWDIGEDLKVYGGVANTLSAAVFNFTINGVPLLFNGEEAGNPVSGLNTHTLIDWRSSHAAQFTAFYEQLIALRNANPALQQGALVWVPNSRPSQVATYVRSSWQHEFLIEINFSSLTVRGTVHTSGQRAWTEVQLRVSRSGAHARPGNFALGPHDFAIFERPGQRLLPPTAPRRAVK